MGVKDVYYSHSASPVYCTVCSQKHQWFLWCATALLLAVVRDDEHACSNKEINWERDYSRMIDSHNDTYSCLFMLTWRTVPLKGWQDLKSLQSRYMAFWIKKTYATVSPTCLCLCLQYVYSTGAIFLKRPTTYSITQLWSLRQCLWVCPHEKGYEV